MGMPELVDTDKAEETSKGKSPKRHRRRIQLIEVKPQPEWTVCAKTEHGRKLWWLRFSATGLRTRRYGPFKSQSVALLVLDNLLDVLGEALCEFENTVAKDLVQDRFGKRWSSGIIEDEMLGKGA